MNNRRCCLLGLLFLAFLYTEPNASDTLSKDTVQAIDSAGNFVDQLDKTIAGAVIDIKADRFHKAIVTLYEVLAVDSTIAKALYYRSQARNMLRELPKALIDVNLSLKYGYDSIKTYGLRREINSKMGDHSQAANDCSHLIALRDWEPYYYFIRGQHRVLSGQIESALTDFIKYYESIPSDNEKRQDEIRKSLKELRKPYGPTVFVEVWKAGREVYLAWEKQDWLAMSARITRGDLKKFKSRMIVAARAKGSIDFEYFSIDGVTYKKSELSQMSPQEFFIFQMGIFSRKQSPLHKLFKIRFTDVTEVIAKGKNKARLRSQLSVSIRENTVSVVVQDDVKLEDGIWKLKLPKLFMKVAQGLYNEALDMY